MTEKSLLIDVEKAIEDKNPRLLKVLPGFVLRYLKKIIHQDDLNEIIQRFHEQEGLDFVEKTLDYMGISYSAEDLENIPEQGRFLFVSNHPLGGLDGLVFIHVIGRIFPDLKFPVNDFLLNIKNLDPVFLPINKHGSQSRDAVRAIEEAYASDSQILYFPAGLCSRKIRGKIVDLEWKKHFITKAIEYKRDIIPVYFSGRNSNFFYNLANLRILLGIKSNIEMIYLPNEMFKQRGKKLILKVGQPIPYTFFDRTRTAKEWADYIKDIVYSIGSTINKTNN